VAIHADDALLEGYLLGEVSEQERTRIELEYLKRPEALERLAAVEHELIDAYVGGELPADRRRRFEAVLLPSPAIQSRVEFARQLLAYVAGQPAPPRPSWWQQALAAFQFRPAAQFAMATLAVVFAAAAVLAFVQLRHARLELARVERERAELVARASAPGQTPAPLQPPGGEGPAPLQTPPPPPGVGKPGAVPQVVTFILEPGLVRGEPSAAPAIVARETDQIRLRLRLDVQEYQSYRATVETLPGREILNRDGLHATRLNGSHVVDFTIPASSLPAGSYLVTLSGRTPAGGSTDVAVYPFAVRRPSR
jgi:hypothetical protein